MKFDSNRAWQEASAAVSANRDVLLALSGVFFLLPSLAFALLVKAPPEAAANPANIEAARDAMMAQMTDWFAAAAPWIAVMSLVQAIGTLALLALFTDRARPTVGEAIRRGLAGTVPYLLAQLMLGLALGLGGGLLLAIAAATGMAAVTAVAVMLVLVAAIYAAIRTALVAPVIGVEGFRNPVAALRRSWDMTTGNAGRIGAFFVLVGVAFLFVTLVVTSVVGIVLALLAGPDTVKVIVAVVSAGIGSFTTLYFVAIMAAIHRQLSGAMPEGLSSTFD